MLGYAGHHSMPFERISLSTDRGILASVSHDDSLRLWDVSRFADRTGDDQDDSDAESESSEEEADSLPVKRGAGRSTKMPKQKKAAFNNFFSDVWIEL